MNVGRVGRFIRDQRTSAKLSLRKLAGLAGVSIPYLSQIERGLRKPSADILLAIAKALRISAEQLYVQAGILEDRPAADVVGSIMSDPVITQSQKSALVQIYQAFRDEAAREHGARSRKLRKEPQAVPPMPGVGARGSASTRSAAPAPRRAGAAGVGARSVHRTGARVSAPKTGGGAASQAGSSPHPAPTRSPASNSRRTRREV